VKNLRLALEIALVRFAIWLLPKLSRPVILRLCEVLGVAAYLIDYRGRAAAHANLKVAFAKENIQPEQVRRIAIRSYQTFARTFMDLFWSRQMGKSNFRSFCEFDDDFIATAATAKAHGALWVTVHYGNFELTSLAVGYQDIELTVIAQDFKNAGLTDIFAKLRQGSGHQVIPQQGAMLRLMKELKRKGNTALLTDLNVKPNKSTAVIDCFGLKTCVTTLHASLARRLDLPVILGLCKPLDDGTYHLIFKVISHKDYPSDAAMTQAVWDYFEKIIREYPENWLWMYKHWRYLPGLIRDPLYPPYANTSSPFRKLMAGKL